MAIYSGFSHEKWWFSIAMLNYQRVSEIIEHSEEFPLHGLFRSEWAPFFAQNNWDKFRKISYIQGGPKFETTPQEGPQLQVCLQPHPSIPSIDVWYIQHKS